ncbi:MAG TPA: hypothetical protein QGH10_09195 [Armatimonadota bacterium]|nr:hypothetical protein [Armatimonadota bacterium]
MRMRVSVIAALTLLLTDGLAIAATGDVEDAGEPFGALTVVDEVLCGDPTDAREFSEAPEGASVVETILGTPCRVLPTEGEAKYFAYRIGEAKGLKPGAAYVLSVEYPEDAPRSMFIGNRGAETSAGFATGTTVGDVLVGRYVNHNPESLQYPLTGELETWKNLFYLHDRFPGIEQPRGAGPRPMTPDQGFWVVISQSKGTNHPMSAGAAVSRIRLFEVPDPTTLYMPEPSLPEGLPKRHVFWREEMGDGVVHSGNEAERGVTDPLDWYRYKARLMRFWGFNTYCKDLLEFGHNQGWDSDIHGGNNWVNQTPYKERWSKILQMVGDEGYNFDVLPYYEYAGSVGGRSIGVQRRCKPLGDTDDYTHITWSEKANADVTDPEQLEDAKRVLEATIVRHEDKANFLGAWFRTRPSHIPIGFGDSTLFRFAVEANGKRVALREDLRADPELLRRYYDWWFQKRKEFLGDLRDYLRGEGVNDEALIMFTADSSEPGTALPGRQIVTDAPDAWAKVVAESQDLEGYQVTPAGPDVMAAHLTAVLSPRPTWDKWEWHHSIPEPDPHRYQDADGLMMTYSFNRAYTAGSAENFDAFRTPAGLAIVRHYALNENEMEEKIGYFVADVERNGPYCMLGEARAMAHGDPRFIGYLSGNSFNRGFPEYVRNFYAAFLALPALPSEVVDGAASDDEVVVRAIPTADHGTYYAVVNTGLAAKTGVAMTLPAGGDLTDAATGEAIPTPLAIDMYACEMRALRVR